MAEYPNLDLPPPPDPLVVVLRECILAMRTSCGWIAQPPRRLIIETIAARAEQVLATSEATPVETTEVG